VDRCCKIRCEGEDSRNVKTETKLAYGETAKSSPAPLFTSLLHWGAFIYPVPLTSINEPDFFFLLLERKRSLPPRVKPKMLPSKHQILHLSIF
jgi:hypothetical protein